MKSEVFKSKMLAVLDEQEATRRGTKAHGAFLLAPLNKRQLRLVRDFVVSFQTGARK